MLFWFYISNFNAKSFLGFDLRFELKNSRRPFIIFTTSIMLVCGILNLAIFIWIATSSFVAERCQKSQEPVIYMETKPRSRELKTFSLRHRYYLKLKVYNLNWITQLSFLFSFYLSFFRQTKYLLIQDINHLPQILLHHHRMNHDAVMTRSTIGRNRVEENSRTRTVFCLCDKL